MKYRVKMTDRPNGTVLKDALVEAPDPASALTQVLGETQSRLLRGEEPELEAGDAFSADGILYPSFTVTVENIELPQPNSHTTKRMHQWAPPGSVAGANW